VPHRRPDVESQTEGQTFSRREDNEVSLPAVVERDSRRRFSWIAPSDFNDSVRSKNSLSLGKSVPPARLERSPDSTSKTAKASNRAAKSAAELADDPELSFVANRWPLLTAEVKQAICRLAAGETTVD
jgi:hypothetical protein